MSEDVLEYEMITRELLTMCSIPMTSSIPMSPRDAATTSGGRPKSTYRISLLLAVGKAEGLTALSDGRDTRVLVVERGCREQRLGSKPHREYIVRRRTNKHDRLTQLVLLVVDRTLKEALGLTRLERVEDEAVAVLGDHAAREGTIDDVEHLRRARVGVRSVHAARAQESDRHSHA